VWGFPSTNEADCGWPEDTSRTSESMIDFTESKLASQRAQRQACRSSQL
jgi:hypothetical protein